MTNIQSTKKRGGYKFLKIADSKTLWGLGL